MESALSLFAPDPAPSGAPLAAGAVHFTVYGTPQAAGSKKGFRVPGTNSVRITDDNKKSGPWKKAVAQVAGELMAGRALLDGPLAATFRFVRARPKGHFKKSGGLNAEGLRTPYPDVKPDVLKLTRGVEDALTGVVYRDDAQICHETILKEYGSPERCEVTIEVLF